MRFGNIDKILADAKRAVASSLTSLISILQPADRFSEYEGSLEHYRDNYALAITEIAAQLPEIAVSTKRLTRGAYADFLKVALPTHGDISPNPEHKKKLEMFISYALLNIDQDSVFMDAAGGGFSYAGFIPCRKSYLQDMAIRDSVKKRVGPHVEYIEASVSGIPLPDNSIDAISCHHAYEHFQGSADIDFILEAQRILKPGGSLVIVPLFLSKAHVEMTDLAEFNNWSTAKANRLFAPQATLPGKKSGNFARIYDIATFRERVIKNIDLTRFSVEIIEPTLDGETMPHPRNYVTHKVSNFNFPYRAFRIISHIYSSHNDI